MQARSVLMIGYHFPPLAGSSGIQRMLRFTQHLPDLGWQPLVLTAHQRAYERTSVDLLDDVPTDAVVRRAFALDTARHLAVGGRYIDALARPDRWMTWRFDAVRQGMLMIRQYRPKVIWSTYPIATAHVIGAELARRSGLPWVADFRDPMAQDGYPQDPKTWAAFKRIEQDAVRRSSLCLFTTRGAAHDYRQRYPEAASRIDVLENGYDEEAFVAAGRAAAAAPRRNLEGPRVLLHSGIVYPAERDPTSLFAALRQLHDRRAISPQTLRVRFRAPVHEELLHRLGREHGVQPYIEVCPAVNYVEALREMIEVDALLILQAANCNQQVPAKLYEYLRAGRPILGLTDPGGDTAAALRASGINAVADPTSAEAIAELLLRLQRGDHGELLARTDAVAAASRRGRARQLARWLDAL